MPDPIPMPPKGWSLAGQASLDRARTDGGLRLSIVRALWSRAESDGLPTAHAQIGGYAYEIADRLATALSATHHLVPKIPTGSYPYVERVDAAVGAARINCWKRPGHGVHYGECCIRAALEVALTPDPARDLWEAERDDLRAQLRHAIHRAAVLEAPRLTPEDAARLRQELEESSG